MQVSGIDHVNIVTDDLDRSAQFYERLLGLTATRLPNAPPGFDGRWLYDVSGKAIIHLAGRREGMHRPGPHPDTGPIDHVALACTGFEAMLARCAELGLDHKINDRKFGTLRQVFVSDPNNVVLELNFAGE
jgi:catechol 2,3-dioxygenase-like lactoylglutathione lyase family enzyme